MLLKICSDLRSIALQHGACCLHDVCKSFNFVEFVTSLNFVSGPIIVELVKLNVLNQHTALIGAAIGIPLIPVFKPFCSGKQTLLRLLISLQVDEGVDNFTTVGRMPLAASSSSGSRAMRRAASDRAFL